MGAVGAVDAMGVSMVGSMTFGPWWGLAMGPWWVSMAIGGLHGRGSMVGSMVIGSRWGLHGHGPSYGSVATVGPHGHGHGSVLGLRWILWGGWVALGALVPMVGLWWWPWACSGSMVGM